MSIDMKGIHLEPVNISWLQIVLFTFALGGAWYMLLDHEEKWEVYPEVKAMISERAENKQNSKDLNSNIVELNLTLRQFITEAQGNGKTTSELKVQIANLRDDVTALKVKVGP